VQRVRDRRQELQPLADLVDIALGLGGEKNDVSDQERCSGKRALFRPETSPGVNPSTAMMGIIQHYCFA
jgi:hypothetical protein